MASPDFRQGGRAQDHRCRGPDLGHDRQARQRRSDAEGRPGRDSRRGTLLPETYLFMRGDTRASIVRRMEKAQKALIAKLCRSARPICPTPRSPRRSRWPPSWRRNPPSLPSAAISRALFVNRLRQGIKLQSDPTIIYSLTGGYPLGRGIRRRRARPRDALQHLCRRRPAAGADLQSGQGFDRSRGSIPVETKDMYFVAAAMAAMSSRSRSRTRNRHVAELRARERAQKNGHP